MGCWVERGAAQRPFTKDSDACWKDVHTAKGQLALRPGRPRSAGVLPGSRRKLALL